MQHLSGLGEELGVGSPSSARSRLLAGLWVSSRTLLRRIARRYELRGPGLTRLIAGSATLLILLGLSLLPGPFSGAHVSCLLGALLALLGVHMTLVGARASATTQALDHSGLLGERLGRRIDQIFDAQRKISGNERRCQQLLDSQTDIILRRDSDGRLAFANSSFYRLFGSEPADALGKTFCPEVIEGDRLAPLSTSDEVMRRSYTQRLATRLGPRWIEWEEQLVPAAHGADFEVQSVGRDVTEHRHVQADLADARDQAEAASRAKSRFLAAMSHEIRTPMNGILGMAGLLFDTPQTPEQQTYTRAIDQSARTLLALIDEILDFSKIEAGKLVLHEAPFAIESCVQGTIELLAPRAHEKGLEIAWTVDPRLPSLVSGDETRVRQILLNLVSNAIKFTDTGGVVVKVLAGNAADTPQAGTRQILISVQDTGIGLSPDDMKGLFGEFEQAEATARRQNGGTGLGLAISKRLARAMGGDIGVVSSPGSGSTFTASLRLKPLASSMDEPLAEKGPKPAAVLLAFDRSLERCSLAHVLRASGVPVTETDLAGGPAALENAAKAGAPFDRVIVDAGADAATAGALLARARALRPADSVRGLVLVNVLARASLAAFRTQGFQSYLVRPVRPSSLLQQLGMGQRASEPVATARESVASGSLDLAEMESQRRVLLAEDNEINALLARRVLQKAGCEVVAVRSGREAVAAVERTLDGREQAFDLILMDIFMPDLDGVEAACAIRNLARPPALEVQELPPIVALTANAFAEDRERYLKAGMDDYLAKPFEKADLEALLMRWLAPKSAPLVRSCSKPAA